MTKATAYKVRSHKSRAEHNRQFRDALGAYPTGVAVVCGMIEGTGPIGLTINSFASVSLDPPLILWSLANVSDSFEAFAPGCPFTVTILSEGQEQVARHFAMADGDRFRNIDVHMGLNGVPIIEGGAAYFECTGQALHESGDHHIIVGKVERFGESGLSSLVFHKGMFRPL